MRTFAALIALLFCTSALAEDIAARRSNESRKDEFPTEPFTGKAWALDGDTLQIGKVRVRLQGADAPEMKVWPWGPLARGVLDDLIAKAPVVTCNPTGKSHNRVVARCFVAVGGIDLDLSAKMIESGYAVEWRTYTNGRYMPFEKAAREAKRGVWKD